MDNKEFLNELLTGENVVQKIRGNMFALCLVMPEISDMIGFEHKHPHHHLDVWEHTLYALSVSDDDFDVRLALLLHDIGKPHSFQEGDVRHFKGHPDMSAKISAQILKRLGYSKKYSNYICEIIKKHDTPLTEEDIFSDPKTAKTIFEVQKCDALAHNPEKNQNRLKYIESIENVFRELSKKDEPFAKD